jgi:predicted DNA-binding transcriptional regulator AlpA
MKDNNKMLKVSEVSAILGIDSRRVWKLINNGELPAINLSSGTVRPKWQIESGDLQKFIESRKSNTNNG